MTFLTVLCQVFDISMYKCLYCHYIYFRFLNWKSKWHGEEESSDYVIWYQLFDADDQKNAAYWMLFL